MQCCSWERMNGRQIVGTAGPEVNGVGPGAERREAWQSCQDPVRWSASRGQGGME